jgi:ATP-dependent DNA helicase RecG
MSSYAPTGSRLGPLSSLRGIGPRLEEKLARLGLDSVESLLFHLPLRYQDRTHITPLGALLPGREFLVEAGIDHTELVYRRRRSLLCHVSDGTGSILLRFFHFSTSQKERLKRGSRIRCYGEVRPGPAGLEMVHPEYQVFDGEAPPLDDVLYPVYPATEGLGQKRLVDLIGQSLDRSDALVELLPRSIRDEMHLDALQDALRVVHRPRPEDDVAALMSATHPAQQRLAFEELLAHQLSLGKLRQMMQSEQAPAFRPGQARYIDQFLKTLLFELTAAQKRVFDELGSDLRNQVPMLRLVQGDVGSGKTVIAALACLMAIEAGYQAAVMAPTEILAAQHMLKFSEWFEALGIPVTWLSGSMTAKARRQSMEQIALGQPGLVVGTHALFQDEVQFGRLGLVVIDEQHRFGVHQRMKLRDKGLGEHGMPHQLIMTATPIPRSLAMTAYADLDLSVIDELPPGRTPIKTVALPDTRRDDVVQRVEQACRSGRQVYWVCTLIEESEALQCEAAEATSVALAEAFPDLKVGLVHGRIKATEKDKVMARFKQGDTQLLVATTVIEVGVDVPNASLMIIENAERLGLSQLHQLRGRVGRGSVESSCVLMYHAPLSKTARRRLEAMRNTNDGFEIARIDMELRGPGELLGTRQTGETQFRVADLLRDQHLVPEVQRCARLILEEYPERVDPLIDRWLGAAQAYGQVG